MTPVFLDSNVFLYAAGAGHPLRAPCQALLARDIERKHPRSVLG